MFVWPQHFAVVELRRKTVYSTEDKVTSSLVVDERRLDFLPRHLGRHYLLGEAMIFDWAGRLSRDYAGGSWEFFELSNGGFYLTPHMQGPVPVACDTNGYAGQMGVEAFGIVVTLFALCHMCERFDNAEHLAVAYHLLRGFARDHAEAVAIFNAID